MRFRTVVLSVVCLPLLFACPVHAQTGDPTVASAEAHASPSPRVEQLLRRVIRSHRESGPLIVTSYVTTAAPGKGHKPIIYSKMVQNSVSEFVLVDNGAISRKLWYFHGKVTAKMAGLAPLVRYTDPQKDGSFGYLFNGVFQDIEASLRWPSSRAFYDSCAITRVRVNGRQCYRITGTRLSRTPTRTEVPFLVMVIDVANGLVYKLSVPLPAPLNTKTWFITYRKLRVPIPKGEWFRVLRLPYRVGRGPEAAIVRRRECDPLSPAPSIASQS